MIACEKNKRIESDTPYKIVVVRTYILNILTHKPPRVKEFLESNLYQLNTNVMTRAKMGFLAYFEANLHFLELKHKRLWHLHANSAKMLQTLVSNMEMEAVLYNVHSFACEGCVQDKQTRRPISRDGGTRATKILELMYDMCGPMKCACMCSNPRAKWCKVQKMENLGGRAIGACSEGSTSG